MLEGFVVRRIETSGVAIHAAMSGEGPPLVRRFTAAATELRSYGSSDKPPLPVPWGENGVVGLLYQPLTSWRQKARNVRGRALPGGRFLPEGAPRETLDAWLDSLAR